MGGKEKSKPNARILAARKLCRFTGCKIVSSFDCLPSSLHRRDGNRPRHAPPAKIFSLRARHRGFEDTARKNLGDFLSLSLSLSQHYNQREMTMKYCRGGIRWHPILRPALPPSKLVAKAVSAGLVWLNN